MVKRHPTAPLLSTALTIPLLLGGCTQHYEVKEPMSQPCRAAAVHSNTIFRPVRGSQFPSFIFNEARIEDGLMRANIGGGWPEDVDLPSYGGDIVEGEPVTIPGTGTFELIGITLSRWGNSPETITFCFTPDPNLLDNAKKHLPPPKHSHPKTRTRKTPYCDSDLCLNHEFVCSLAIILIPRFKHRTRGDFHWFSGHCSIQALYFLGSQRDRLFRSKETEPCQ